jgi:hypothetical protein
MAGHVEEKAVQHGWLTWLASLLQWQTLDAKAVLQSVD